MFTNQGYTCDAISFDYRKPIPESRCGKPATWQRQSDLGGMLHHCEKHSEHSKNPTIQQFKPAPLSIAERITP